MRHLFSLIVLIFAFSVFILNTNNHLNRILIYKHEDVLNNNDNLKDIEVNSALFLYECIEKYSEIHNVPKYIAYNIAYKETGYRGPFHHNYKQSLVSHAGAMGSMQVMPSTANLIQGSIVDKDELLHNIELNVEISMKLVERLYKKYKNWYIVCGAYNTGRPLINGYAEYCAGNKNYKKVWVKKDLN